MKIGLFDTSSTFRKVIMTMSDLEHVTWRQFSGIKDGGKALLEEAFDIILTSRILDQSDYQDVLIRMHASPLNRDTPVYLLTSSETPDLISQAYGQGVTEVFTKDEIPMIIRSIQRMFEFFNQVKGAKVLLIDDQKSLTELYREILTQAGFEVFIACSLQEAFPHLVDPAKTLDLIITDLNLGQGEQGQRLIRKVREHSAEEHQNLPILVISGTQEMRIQIGLYYLGIDDFLVKPIQPKQLVMRATSLIEKYRIQRRIDELLGIYRGRAIFDALTGLYNRHGFAEISQHFVADCARSKCEVSVLYCDLDNFKPVNDKQGHDAGDRVLKQVATLLNQCLRKSDFACRWGGDEFVALLKGGAETSVVAGERILTQFKEQARELLGVGCSIGLTAGTPQSIEELMALIDQADTLLSKAKAQGKGRVYMNL